MLKTNALKEVFVTEMILDIEWYFINNLISDIQADLMILSMKYCPQTLPGICWHITVFLRLFLIGYYWSAFLILLILII